MHRRFLLLSFLALGAACGDDSAPVDQGTDAGDAAPDGAPTDAGIDMMPLIDAAMDAAPDMEVPPSCDDEVQNGDETDVDCGGSCDPCVDGLSCMQGSDCTSEVCEGGTCAAPRCGDGVQNGMEACDTASADTPCCLDDCTGAAPEGTVCGDDPDDDGCAAAPRCNGADTGAASCTDTTEDDGAPCTDDGMFCTGLETCSAGACVSAGDPCPGADGDADCAESCDEMGDTCTGPDALDASCDDGDFCTTTDLCDGAGMCVGSGSPCPADRVCAVDACVRQTFFYYGDFVDNGVEQVASYDPAADSVRVLDLMDFDPSDINDLAFSNDGSVLALGAEFSTAPSARLVLYDGDLSGAPRVIADDTGAANTSTVEIRRIAFSPDGMNVAFTADLERNGADSLYVAPTSGASAPRRLTPLPTGNQDALALTWVGNTHIAFVGDVVTDEVDNAYTVDIATATLVPLVDPALLSTAENVSTFNIQVDDAGRIYFASSHLSAGVFALFRAEVDGTGLEQVPETALTRAGGEAASVSAFSISPSGTRIAFGADAVTEGLFEIHVVETTPMPAPAALVSAIATPTMGETRGVLFQQPVWSPDESMLAVVADWGTTPDNDFAAFLLSTTMSGGVRISGPNTPGNNQDVSEVVFSADGAYVVLRGDLVSNNNGELFVTSDFTTPDQDPSTLRFEEVPTGGDVISVVARR